MTKEELLINPLILQRLNLYGLTKMHQEGFTGKGIKVGVIDRFDIEHGHNVVSCITDELCGTAPGASIKEYHLPKDFNWGHVVNLLKECIVDEVDIINLSIGIAHAPTELHTQIKRCDDNNIIMCAAVGNEGDEYRDWIDIKLYPEEYPEVTSWGSIDSNLEWSSFNSHGKSLDFVGVGSNTPIRMKDGSYQLGSGSSFSSPHGAGIFACILDKFRCQGQNPPSKDVKQYLIDRSVDMGTEGHDWYFGYGVPTLDIDEHYKTRRALGVVRKTIKMQIGNPMYEVNGEIVMMDTVPIIDDNNRTLTPARAVAEALGAKVSWDEETQTVIIEL